VRGRKEDLQGSVLLFPPYEADPDHDGPQRKEEWQYPEHARGDEAAEGAYSCDLARHEAESLQSLDDLLDVPVALRAGRADDLRVLRRAHDHHQREGDPPADYSRAVVAQRLEEDVLQHDVS
jgi:hypothetical protein